MFHGQFSAYFGAIFVTIATVKAEIDTRLLHLGYCSNKLIRGLWKKAIFFEDLDLCFQNWQNCHLNSIGNGAA